jgi:hypothetical protein
LARASVREALANMAVLKNVPLSDEERVKTAEDVLAELNLMQFHQLPALEREALAARSRIINTHLDTIAIARVLTLVMGIEGTDSPHDPVVQAITREIAAKFEPALSDKPNVRWPAPAALVWAHYAGKARGPTMGRRADGTVCTRWWLGLEFHRDPSEGPANIEVRGERRLEEFWFNGQRHRPHADGPAVAYTHYENFDLSGEEYVEHGKWHRPSHLGPAVTHWDRSGAPVMVIYFENGDYHRDPKAGPAWWHIRDVRTNKEASGSLMEMRYCVRGQLHRDETDGPAVIVIDNVTGVIVEEQYWRDGLRHRDGGPAIIERAPNGVITYEAYWLGTGKGCAIRRYDASGGLLMEEWFGPDGLRRDASEGPGSIGHDGARGRTREDYYIDDTWRPAPLGPASVTRDRKGKLLWEEFWDGEQMQVRYPKPAVAEARDG